MKKIFMMLVAVLAAAMFVACGDSKEVVDPGTDPNQPVKGDEFVVPEDTNLKPTVSSGGGTQTLTFTAKEHWRAYVADSRAASDWLRVSPTEGDTGEVTLSITTAYNEAEEIVQV